MSELLNRTAELTAYEQQLFIDRLEELKPLLGKPSTEVAYGDPVIEDGSNPHATTSTFTNFSKGFNIDDSIVQLSISEWADFDDSPVSHYSCKRYVVYVTSLPEQLGDRETYSVRQYTITNTKDPDTDEQVPEFEERQFSRMAEESKWTMVPTALDAKIREWMAALEKNKDGRQLLSEADDILTAEKELEELTGESSRRFSLERFVDVMDILDQIELASKNS